MKLKTFFKLLAAFCAGLVLCGVGVGVCIMEITSLKVVEAGTKTAKTERDYTLPEGERLYIGDLEKSELIADSDIPVGTLRLSAEHSEDAEIQFNDIENMYLYEERTGVIPNEDMDEDDFEDMIEDDFEDMDEDDFEDMDEDDFEERSGNYGVERHRVIGLLTPGFYFGDDDWNEFTQMLEHLKNKEIYVSSNKAPKFKVYINPDDADRVVCVSGRAWLEEGSVYIPEESAKPKKEKNEETTEQTTVSEQSTESFETTVETTVQPVTDSLNAGKPAA